ncbi:hypothetical protein GQ42DRAFT_116844 [Ramicandelaber brevisporus]|nr:hypothetical protein GQ42DRAFT_116844 [Ramicandelaber brevisporus]
MQLLNLTLSAPTAVACAVPGHFSDPKRDEIALLRGSSTLELVRPDPDTGKLLTVSTQELFCHVRSMVAFKLLGSRMHHLVVGSDSGAIAMLAYHPRLNMFVRVQWQAFGRSGNRRAVAGEYVAADPRGRAVFIGAIDQARLAYIVNHGGQSNETTNGDTETDSSHAAIDSSPQPLLSSPISSDCPRTVLFDVVGVDVGYDNPIFACLETSYEAADADISGIPARRQPGLLNQTLAYYEVDLGLKRFVRRWEMTVDRTSHKLIPIPGDKEGPGGVLVCSSGWISYISPQLNIDQSTTTDDQSSLPVTHVRAPIPMWRRKDGAEHAAGQIKKRQHHILILLQSEHGDLFRVKLGIDQTTNQVNRLSIEYFDTIPVASSLCLFTSGYLLATSETGDHFMYSLNRLGDDAPVELSSDDVPTHALVTDREIQRALESLKSSFMRRPLTNITIVDIMESLSPLTSANVLNLGNEMSPQVYGLRGYRNDSRFTITRYGLEAEELSTGALPPGAQSLWSSPAPWNQSGDDGNNNNNSISELAALDTYVLVAFANHTLVLELGETIDVAKDTPFVTNRRTFAIRQLESGIVVQVHSTGVRSILNNAQTVDWKVPRDGGEIVCAAINTRQVIIALSSGSLMYFELDNSRSHSATGQSLLVDRQVSGAASNRRVIRSAVTCLAVGEVPNRRTRYPFVAVGCADSTLRLMSLAPDRVLSPILTRSLDTVPESLAFFTVVDRAIHARHPTTWLYVGLRNGTMARSVIAEHSMQFSYEHTQVLAGAGVGIQLQSVQVGSDGNTSAILAMGAVPWLSYYVQGRHTTVPVTYEAIVAATTLRSEHIGNCIAALSGKQLCLIQIAAAAARPFNHAARPLTSTPRRFAQHPVSSYFVVAEADHQATAASSGISASNQADTDSGRIDETDGDTDVDGPVRGPNGSWLSAVRLIDPYSPESHSQLFELDANEAAFSIVICQFASRPGETFALVGTATGLTPSPYRCESAAIRTYKFSMDGTQLEFVHSTPIDVDGAVPHCMVAFDGRLLVGLGRMLRIYDMGKQRLLRKCQSAVDVLPSRAITLHTPPEAPPGANGLRFVVGDARESVLIGIYHRPTNTIRMVADDALPRYITCSAMLDADTVVAGDKFGNVFVLRLPDDARKLAANATAVTGITFGEGWLNGQCAQFELVASFHVGEMITSLIPTTLLGPGRASSNSQGKANEADAIVVYTTILGRIGVLAPFKTRSDFEFMSAIETRMRAEMQLPIQAETAISYRGKYSPVKAVIDGDLCEMFGALGQQRMQKAVDHIAETSDETIEEFLRRIARFRAMYSF